MVSSKKQESGCPRYSLSAYCATILSPLMVRCPGRVTDFNAATLWQDALSWTSYIRCSPLLHALVDRDDPHEVSEQSVQWCMLLFPSPTNLMPPILSWTTSLTSRSVVCWQSGPCQLFLCLGPRCRPVLDGTAQKQHFFPLLRPISLQGSVLTVREAVK